MNLAHFLERRIAFVEYFHSSATAAYQETKRQIEAGDLPFVDMRNPEDADEPAFLTEWEDASTAITVVGAACLDMLQATLHEFLKYCLREIGLGNYIPKIRGGKDGWLGGYRTFYKDALQIDWEKSGADLGLLEQIILTRNDFTHNPDFRSLNAFKLVAHGEKYPDSAFTDPMWKELWFSKESTPLVVPTESLVASIAFVRTLCEYLEREGYAWQLNVKARRTEVS
jgi:hypothetical protein